jgi:hypothetical protein
VDLEQELIVRVLAHRLVEELHGSAVPFQLLDEQHLMNIVAGEPIRRSDEDVVEPGIGRRIAQVIQCASDPVLVVASWRHCSRRRERHSRLAAPSIRQDAGSSEHRSDLRLVFDIQGLSSLHDLACAQRQLQLTSGRCSYAAAP